MNKTKQAAASVLLVAASLLLSFGIGELVVRYTVFSAEERAKGAVATWQSFSNEFMQMSQNDEGCTFSDRLIPHPNLAFVHHSFPRCGIHGLNALGLISRTDLPRQRSLDYYTIMIVGGSVASHLAAGTLREGRIWLQDILNRDYVSPNGKPFRIVSGAAGGWRVPAQLTALELNGEGVDAVMAVDGYNEASAAGGGAPITSPDPVYLTVVQPHGAAGPLRWIWALQRYRQFAMKFWPTRHSFLAFTIFDRMVNLFSQSASVRETYDSYLYKHFAFPQEWTPQKRDEWNRTRYETYLRSLEAKARVLNLKYAHFLQPVRWIGKQLTEEEKSYREYVKEGSYESVFLPVVASMRSKGFPTVSLTDVFTGIAETIYGDHIHCRYGSDGDSPGYRIMSERIARELSRFWGLKRRKE